MAHFIKLSALLFVFDSSKQQRLWDRIPQHNRHTAHQNEERQREGWELGLKSSEKHSHRRRVVIESQTVTDIGIDID